MDWMKKLADERIKQAQREGVFDDLQGKGKPLSPDRHADLPDATRMASRLMDSAGFVPEEVELLKQLNEARERLREAATPEERKARMREYTQIELRFNLGMERMRRMSGGSF